MDSNRERPTHALPTHLTVSQPLLMLGPLRLDVLALCKLAVGCLVASWLWQLHGPPTELRLLGVVLAGLVTLLLVTAHPGGLPLEAWVVPLLVFSLRPRLRVWRARTTSHPWVAAAPTSAPADNTGGWYRLAAIQVRWAGGSR